jgi:ketosteroid isomerase-like protein
LAFLSLVMAAGAGAALTACQPRPGPAVITAQVIDDIKADEVDWNADYRSGDPARVVAHFAPHALIMTPDAAPVQGTEAIKALFDQAYQDPHFLFGLTSDKVDVAASGDLAAARGVWSETRTDPRSGQLIKTQGAYIMVYKPQPGGKWRVIWESLTPTPPPSTGAPS